VCRSQQRGIVTKNRAGWKCTEEWHSDFANVFFTVKWNGPLISFRYRVHWKHSIKRYVRGKKKIFLCCLKYMRFLLLYKMPFLRNWIKLYFNLMKLFDWNETLSFDTTLVTTVTTVKWHQMTVKMGDVWRIVTSQKNWYVIHPAAKSLKPGPQRSVLVW
jgi:hypothetical protein